MNAGRRPRIAVVLFNLGGPDRPEAVRPFLFNLFADPSNVRLPWPARLPLAYLNARRRARQAAEIYEQLGGGSPLLPDTEAQARALDAALAGLGEVRCFTAMRYWQPMSDECAYQVKDFDPDQVILLPLHPQFSTATTASSLRLWERAAGAAGLAKPTRVVCCYPEEAGFIEAQATLVRRRYEEASRHGRPRVLLSAHGLAKKVAARGDPYQWQCERTRDALVARLGIEGLDWVCCYQSGVGPAEWIGPSTAREIGRAGRDGVPVVVVPIAFVSGHWGTLVEIGVEYRRLAEREGVPWFACVPAVGAEPAFIEGLAGLVRRAHAAAGRGPVLCSGKGGRICPPGFKGCPHAS